MRVQATLVLRHKTPGRAAFNVLAGALEAVEDEGGLEIVVARSFEALVEATERAVAARRATCVAWSFYSASLPDCAEELARLRERVPHGFTSLAGGVHATAEPLETLLAGFDRVVIGEGEHAVRELARALRDRGSIDDVRGVARLDVVRSEPAPRPTSAPPRLEEPGELQRRDARDAAALVLGRPHGRTHEQQHETTHAIHHVDARDEAHEHALSPRGVGLAQNGRALSVARLDDFPAFAPRRRLFGAIEITRGCIYACRFCQTPFVAKARFRHRSIENVAHWAGEIARAGLRDVRFVSPTSLSYGTAGEEPDLDAVEALLAAVRGAIGPRGRLYFGTFPSEVRPEHVTPRALAVLKRFVDNDNLVIGGQSGSERVLAASHRGHDVASIERAVRVALEAGFRPNVDFLLGLPGEEHEDALATAALIERLTALGARAHGHTFLPLPGTPFRDAAAGSIDDDVRARLSALEGSSRVFGQWRAQERLARELQARRAATVAARRGAR